jgi:hypothetical protein
MQQPEILQWHVTWVGRGRSPLAPDEARRRLLVRELVARGGPHLVLFCLVDDHVHVWLIGTLAELKKAIRKLGFGLRALAATPLRAPHVERVEQRSHAEALVPYLLTQTEHHGLGVHPAAWSGAPLADLLGARQLEGWRPRLWDALPRHPLLAIHAAVGLPNQLRPPPPTPTSRSWERVASRHAPRPPSRPIRPSRNATVPPSPRWSRPPTSPALPGSR